MLLKGVISTFRRENRSYGKMTKGVGGASKIGLWLACWCLFFMSSAPVMGHYNLTVHLYNWLHKNDMLWLLSYNKTEVCGNLFLVTCLQRFCNYALRPLRITRRHRFEGHFYSSTMQSCRTKFTYSGKNTYPRLMLTPNFCIIYK